MTESKKLSQEEKVQVVLYGIERGFDYRQGESVGGYTRILYTGRLPCGILQSLDRQVVI